MRAVLALMALYAAVALVDARHPAEAICDSDSDCMRYCDDKGGSVRVFGSSAPDYVCAEDDD